MTSLKTFAKETSAPHDLIPFHMQTSPPRPPTNNQTSHSLVVKCLLTLSVLTMPSPKLTTFPNLAVKNKQHRSKVLLREISIRQGLTLGVNGSNKLILFIKEFMFDIFTGANSLFRIREYRLFLVYSMMLRYKSLPV